MQMQCIDNETPRSSTQTCRRIVFSTDWTISNWVEFNIAKDLLWTAPPVIRWRGAFQRIKEHTIEADLMKKLGEKVIKRQILIVIVFPKLISF